MSLIVVFKRGKGLEIWTGLVGPEIYIGDRDSLPRWSLASGRAELKPRPIARSWEVGAGLGVGYGLYGEG
mgnify:CR=1 FL=1